MTQRNPGMVGKTVVVFSTWYDNDLVDEEAFLGWYDVLQADSELKKKCARFMDWLKTADEEEEWYSFTIIVCSLVSLIKKFESVYVLIRVNAVAFCNLTCPVSVLDILVHMFASVQSGLCIKVTFNSLLCTIYK